MRTAKGAAGKFFLWTPAEVTALLGPECCAFLRLFRCHGAWQLPRGRGQRQHSAHPKGMAAVARELKVTPERLAQALSRRRTILFTSREQRVHPGRDEKVLAEWNGLMIHAFAEAGAALDRPDYLAAAERAAEFVLTRMGEWENGSGRISKSASQQMSKSRITHHASRFTPLPHLQRRPRTLNAYLRTTLPSSWG